ncbi:oxygen-regulated protein 1 [Synchiropus splendidus]|uniref:oxygen-regulated protein 1 n=1 Tax=Synchiropus splendidus TaxID=270530 RepID=UPI00237D79FB|nr:oxygen-regulated protein 1 [Synchiropus splendidus]XP_053740100.1 oxygen-regulated protein 1 [Synchiropus splendidus]XP_053740101.1 oxygen-regulated protein 1 [Synchiropus splendidus]
MSEAATQDQPAQAGSSGSGQTLPSRLLQPVSDPSASKRVCFYKSGDLKFSGHRMVINGRTFKTFDALLDTLSNKVPLPFGVRTITTPRGTHVVKGLEDLHDGGSYVCSDQKRVKPLDLAEVNRRQVPWNTTRPFSTGRQRRQGLLYGRRNEVKRPEKTTERVAVRTPKRLVVIKNRDPTVKRTIVLQKRTAPTFDALLDYLSQILQFPVLKLYSTDGRRVGGLAALILCSGVIVAAGSEPFRLANSVFRGSQTGQPLDAAEPLVPQTHTHTNKSSSGRGSRNFSLSSEKHIVNQINQSLHRKLRHHESAETEVERQSVPLQEDSPTDGRHYTCIMPRDDDIEKSFRVNQDGSMTVEMKVHLTIKEEETLHWTTTLSRSTICKRTSCAPVCESRRSSPDSNNASEGSSSPTSEDDTKEVSHSSFNGKAVCFNSEEFYEAKSFKRRPTPGPVKKKASVESVRMESGHQEKTVSQYSYMEKTDDGEMTEEYCVVRHTSSSSSYPVPKPRNSSAGNMRSGVGTSGIAEVLQIQNHGMDVRETVMHIYESHGGFDNYLANEEYTAGATQSPRNRASGGSEVPSSSNDIDFSATDSLPRQRDEMLSLSSEPLYPVHQPPSNLPSVAETEAPKVVGKDLKKKDSKASRSQKSSTSTSGSDKKGSAATLSKNSKHSSPDKVSSNTSVERKSLASGATKRDSKREKQKASTRSAVNGATSKKQTRTAAKTNGHNVNTPTERPQMKKNISDILTPKKSSGKKRRAKTPPTNPSEPRENVSIKSLNASQKEIQQYVESWLEEVSPDQVPYTDDARESTASTKVLFKLGADSESDEKNGTNAKQEGLTSDTSGESASSLTAPPSSGALQPDVCPLRGLSTSAPNVRVDAVDQEGMQRSHRSAEALAPLQWEPSTASPKIKALPLLQQMYASDQEDKSESTDADKSTSIASFSSQVASVFGASCKALLSFLSVMTLRDTLAISSPSKTNMAPEAMLMLESLQKISTIEDQEEQRASLTELQSRTSSQLRNRWTAFQIMRDRLHSEPPSPKVSETEFALDVVSEEGDFLEEQKGIEELMEELNMPQDLREEISLTIHHSKCLYPALEGAGESREVVEEEANSSEEATEGASVDLVKDPDVKESDVSETHDDEKLGEELAVGGGITSVTGRMESEDECTEEESVVKEEEGTASGMREELKEEAGKRLADMDDSVVDTDERDAEETEGGEEQSETEDRNIIATIEEEVDTEEEDSGGSHEEQGGVSDEDQTHQEEEKTVVLSDEESEEDGQTVSERAEDLDEKNKPDEEEVEAQDGLQEEQTDGENEQGGSEDGEGGERTVAAHEQVLEEASYLTQQGEKSSPDELQNSHEDDKDQTEVVTEAESEEPKQSRSFQPHPAEISQELLDFINSALQSASLVFTYDSQGQIRVTQDKHRAVPTRTKRRKKSMYSSKRLPSPNTSELSDYRPESDESGAPKTVASLEIASEDGERTSVSEAQSVRHTGDSAAEGNSQSGSSKSPPANPEASTEDGSSLRAHPEAAPEVASEHDAADGVLIDRGRWLLKENHLIRKSPPLAQGMYGQLDSSSLDTLDSPTQSKTMQSPLGAISSSELEDLAKPPSPKCTYYNMPHGSDSDPFSDDYSSKRGAGRGARVSPTVDTSKTWANKNGSLSSFTSVEFKMHDRKIHPQEETIVVTQARGTSRVREGLLQEQDSMENLRLRCNQYCPIL